MGLIQEVGAGPVAIDTCVFIYWIEARAPYLSLIEPLFERIAAGKLAAVTSALTLLETLVVPYRARDAAVAERYEELLTRSRNLRLIELGRGQLRIAAQLRARLRIGTADALQLAAAYANDCAVFVTNDRALPPAVGPIKVVQLRGLAAAR